MASIQKLKEQRFIFLERVYELSGASKFNRLNMFEVGAALGFSKEETSGICEYLTGEFLIEYASLGGGIAITHEGVLEVEAALSHPDEPTHYFPPVNVIHVEHMHQSQIQQGTVASSQTTVFAPTTSQIAEFASDLEEQVASLSLSNETNTELQSELTTVKAQLDSPRPKTTILQEALSSIRSILEGAAGNVIARQLLAQLSAMGI